MIPELTNPQTTALIVATLVLYVLLVLQIVSRIVRSDNNKAEIHNEYTKENKQTYDYVITSNQCPICERIDKIHIDTDDLDTLCGESLIEVGEYTIVHNEGLGVEEHRVKHYLSSRGEYVGEEIPYEDLRQVAELREFIGQT
jgi:hypothetical protein